LNSLQREFFSKLLAHSELISRRGATHVLSPSAKLRINSVEGGRIVISTGFALLGLGLACWPGLESAGVNNPALRALITYNLLATLYLAYLGIGDRLVGSLLWPAVVIHGVLTLLFARAWRAPVGVERVKQ